MELLSPDIIRLDVRKIAEIDTIMKSIYRLILYSRHHLDDDLLDTYLSGIHTLKDLVGIKNAQMEAQDSAELEQYLIDLRLSLDFIVDEIADNCNFTKEVQLFQLLRIISPATHALHPNRYRSTLVQVGGHVCPVPESLPHLVADLFHKLSEIQHPVIKAIYFHHELLRIHPFADGNGRVSRIAKNWMLMYDLYPPIYINTPIHKKEYISTLSQSFAMLSLRPYEWNIHTEAFFEQELDRLVVNANLLYDSINQLGLSRIEQLRQ